MSDNTSPETEKPNVNAEIHNQGSENHNQKDIFLAEILHRFKNNLQVIASLLSIQGDYVKDDESRKMFGNSSERVKTMAMIYGKQYQSIDLTGIYFNKYLHDLVIYIFNQNEMNSKNARHEIITDDVILSYKTAIPCGLIINELITNSLKHAFKDGKVGFIKVKLEKKTGEYLLSIEDNGTGFPEDFNFETNDSLGLMLVRLLADQINGKLEIDGINGAKFVLCFPQERE